MALPSFTELVAAEDPYPGIDRLRREDPVHFVAELGFWVVFRHDDAKRLFHDPENVTNDNRVWEHHVPAAEGSLWRWAEENGLFSVGPEEHARIRRLVSAAFTPRAVRRMERQIRDVVERVARPLLGRRGEVLDLFGDFSNVIPNTVMSRITGVPPAGDDEERFRKLAQSAIAGFFPFTPPELKARAHDSFSELASWVRELCAKRRANPAEDLISDLLLAQDADARLSDDDIVLLVTGLLAAGTETTALAGMHMARHAPRPPRGRRAPPGRSLPRPRRDRRADPLLDRRARRAGAVSVRVTNTGERAGDEVAQLYIRDRVSSATRPVKELKGFERVSLEPGASAVVEFELGPDALSLIDSERRRVVEPGVFDVMVGGSSEDLRSTTLTVEAR